MSAVFLLCKTGAFMEFFIMAKEIDLLNIKQKLTEKGISYQIKTINNTARVSVPLSSLFVRNQKNNYSILVKQECAEIVRQILKQYGII